MSHWFFLSYARDNGDKYLHKFYRDLNNAIHNLAAPGEGTDGFFDVEDIKLGADWPAALSSALQNCRTFVSLYSPAYFTKEYCGKEWQAFSARQTANSSDLPEYAACPSLMMPVLWVPEARLPSPLPEAVSAVQYKHADLGEVYAREGLRQIMALKKYTDHYREFVMNFADRLIQAVRTHPLPPARRPPRMAEVENAFRLRPAPAVNRCAEAGNTGPRFVQFVFVAGRRNELSEVRKTLDPYGEEGGFDWRPYCPEVVEEVGIIAQEVATREKLYGGFMPLDEDIVGRIKDAECQNKIVAIIVDTWTLNLQRYRAFMSEYDGRNFINCAVLVPWNNWDDETQVNRSVLVNRMWGTFYRHAVKPDPNCFLDSISSPDELRKGLSAALNKARERIVEKAEVIRKAENGPAIPKPRIM